MLAFIATMFPRVTVVGADARDADAARHSR
jgi:hypothetical protein